MQQANGAMRANTTKTQPTKTRGPTGRGRRAPVDLMAEAEMPRGNRGGRPITFDYPLFVRAVAQGKTIIELETLMGKRREHLYRNADRLRRLGVQLPPIMSGARLKDLVPTLNAIIAEEQRSKRSPSR